MSDAAKEQLKLLATTFNTLGLTILAVASLRPIFEGAEADHGVMLSGSFTALVLHVVAQYTLSYIR